MKNYELTPIAPTKLTKLPVKGIEKHYHNEINIFNKWLAGRQVGQDSFTDFFNYLQQPYEVQRKNKQGKIETVTKTRSASTLQKYRFALQTGSISYLKKFISLKELAELKEFFKNIKLKSRGTHRVSRDMSLTKKELAQMENKAGPKTSLMITALYETGARVSELLNIMLSDCIDEGEYIKITIQKDKRNQSKTTVIAKELYNAIRQAYPGDVYLFEGTHPKTKQRTGKPLRSETAYKMIKAAGKLINKKISPHCLRHSKANNMLDDGLSIDRVADHLGNTPATCLQFYCHNELTPGEVAEYNRARKAVNYY